MGAFLLPLKQIDCIIKKKYIYVENSNELGGWKCVRICINQKVVSFYFVLCMLFTGCNGSESQDNNAAEGEVVFLMIVLGRVILM